MPRRDVLVDLAGRAVRVGTGAGTVLTAVGPDWYINGQITNPGAAAEGQLLNTRMVQGIFDAETATGTTPDDFAYPTFSTWEVPRDPDRNVSELISYLDDYRAYGMHMLTVCMQGGAVGLKDVGGYFLGGSGISAWNASGSIKAAWQTRLVSLLEAADAVGMIVNLQAIYHGRDHILTDNAAVQNACENLIDIILDPAVNGVKHFQNVLLEIGNELSAANVEHTLLDPLAGLGTLISNLRTYITNNHAGKTLLMSFSQGGGALPPDALRGVIDYYSLHAGDPDTEANIRAMVDNVRGHGNYNDQPIQFTEATSTLTKASAAVVDRGVGWGYYDQGNPQTNLGESDYMTGFQSPPVNWSPVSTALKQSVFEQFDAWT